MRDGLRANPPRLGYAKSSANGCDSLSPPLSRPRSAVENPTPDPPKVQPQTPPDDTKVQPLLNPSLSSSEEISNNQDTLPRGPRSLVLDQPKNLDEPTWTDIQPDDLRQDARSEALWQEAIQRGHLKNTQADRINFFAAIAHALRVAKHNACGLLRTVVEQRLWHFLSQADEYNAIQRLRRADRRARGQGSAADAHRIPSSRCLPTGAGRSMSSLAYPKMR